MKTIHAARPHHPTYSESMTARRPVLELALCALLCALLLGFGLAAIKCWVQS